MRGRAKAISEGSAQLLRYARQFRMLTDAIAKMEVLTAQARAAQYRRFGLMLSMACVDMATGHDKVAVPKLEAAMRALLTIRLPDESPRPKRGNPARGARE